MTDISQLLKQKFRRLHSTISTVQEGRGSGPRRQLTYGWSDEPPAMGQPLVIKIRTCQRTDTAPPPLLKISLPQFTPGVEGSLSKSHPLLASDDTDPHRPPSSSTLPHPTTPGPLTNPCHALCGSLLILTAES